MRRRLFTSLAAATAVAASLLITAVTPAAAQPATAASAAEARGGGGGRVTPNEELPETIKVKPDENLKVVATLRGTGAQVYTCGTDGKFPTAPREPVATLQNARGNDARGNTVGIHGKGPFWASFDGSRVDGSTTVPPISVPQTGTSNIPWLKVTGNPVPNAPGVFGNVKVIQRIDTSGGVAPTTPPCAPGSTKAVDYSTNYVFWAPK